MVYAIQTPLGRGAGIHPVQWLGWRLGGSRPVQSPGQGLALFRSDLRRGERYKDRRATARQQVKPLGIQGPWNRVGSYLSDAIRVHVEKSILLGQTESEAVDAHFAGAFPFPAAGVIADALQFKKSGR